MLAAPPPPWTREHPFSAILVRQNRLTPASHSKDVRHIEIDLNGSDLNYEPGDTLGIWIRNDARLAAAILARCALEPGQEIELAGAPTTLLAALTDRFELTQAHPGFIKHYAGVCGHAELRQLAMDSKALRAYLERRQIIDVLQQFPAALEASQLLACLRHLTPRQYSIASSPLVAPHQVHLTVNMVRYAQNNETREGAASAFLGGQMHEGDRLPVFVVPNPNFRLPPDGAAPVVMVGPGTGIAPFRAFLQHREKTGATGDNWLFFGNPRRSEDFLYADEMLAWRDGGLLRRLDLAFSRDQEHKIYVQHRMLEQAAGLFAWLERGAYLYVCGDARHMAEDVQQALLRIIGEQGGMDPAAARQYLVRMRQEKRYQRDVY